MRVSFLNGVGVVLYDPYMRSPRCQSPGADRGAQVVSKVGWVLFIVGRKGDLKKRAVAKILDRLLNQTEENG